MRMSDRIGAAWRAFKLGSAVASPQMMFGAGGNEYSPAEYGNYLLTSNNVYSIANQRARMLSSVPLTLYKRNASGDRKEVTSGALYDLTHRVNPFWTMRRLIQMTELSLCLWGAGFWFLERGERGNQVPREIWWARPDRVTVVPHRDNYIERFIYTAPWGDEIAFSPGETIWFHYPNPLDEYSGLSPIAAARLAADMASAGMKSNLALFRNGMQLGGIVVPKEGTTLTRDQAAELRLMIEERYQGVENAHKWGVLMVDASINELGVNPKDAEFLAGLNWSLEEICRAFAWPIDLVGGQRTYENVNAAHKAAWTQCLQPECEFIADEITEQLIPLFSDADMAEFDLSGVEVLHEAESDKWMRAKEQIASGAITINEWRAQEGLSEVPWGAAWWAPMGVNLVQDMTPRAPAGDGQPTTQASASAGHARATGTLEFGGEQHRLVWARFCRQTEQHEKALAAVVIALLKRQLESILAAAQKIFSSEEINPFDMGRWVALFRDGAHVPIRDAVSAGAQDGIFNVGLSLSFDVTDPVVKTFIAARAQRFAEAVNDTTWNALRDALGAAIEDGSDMTTLETLIKDIMGDRIRSTPETIARTEVIGAYNGGTLEGWVQTGVVKGKVWLSSLDDRTRTPPESEFDHVGAHGEEVGIREPFVMTGESLMYPGDGAGSAGNVINCRCTMTAIL